MPAPTSHAHVQDSRHARLGLPRENVHLPDGLAEDSEAACRAYSEAIRALGGLDLQLLGISPRGQTLRPPHESYGDRPFGFLSHQPEEPVHSARWIAGQNGFAAKPPQREATP